MLDPVVTPLVRLGNLFPGRAIYAKCEFLAPSGSFKYRGIRHLLERLSASRQTRPLIVPSMGNTALAAAVGAAAAGINMVGVVPTTISKAKHDRLKALGVELVLVDGGGSELLSRATALAEERDGYFVHPHLDPNWTDGYRSLVAEVQSQLPDCATIAIPVGGGGLLVGVLAYLQSNPGALRVVGCEPRNFPKYAEYSHARSATIADGLLLDKPHPAVQQAIAAAGTPIELVEEEAIRTALRCLYETHGLVVEPSSAIAVACVQTTAIRLADPVCVVLTGANITREDHARFCRA